MKKTVKWRMNSMAAHH